MQVLKLSWQHKVSVSMPLTLMPSKNVDNHLLVDDNLVANVTARRTGCAVFCAVDVVGWCLFGPDANASEPVVAVPPTPSS